MMLSKTNQVRPLVDKIALTLENFELTNSKGYNTTDYTSPLICNSSTIQELKKGLGCIVKTKNKVSNSRIPLQAASGIRGLNIKSKSDT